MLKGRRINDDVFWLGECCNISVTILVPARSSSRDGLEFVVVAGCATLNSTDDVCCLISDESERIVIL